MTEETFISIFTGYNFRDTDEAEQAIFEDYFSPEVK